MADINQGCIPILFSFAGIYCSIIFYFKFGEVLSWSKIFGLILMIISVVMLSLASTQDKPLEEDEETESLFTDDHTATFGFLAILFGMLAPVCFTTKAVFLRLCESKYKFKIWDFGIDG